MRLHHRVPIVTAGIVVIQLCSLNAYAHFAWGKSARMGPWVARSTGKWVCHARRLPGPNAPLHTAVIACTRTGLRWPLPGLLTHYRRSEFHARPEQQGHFPRRMPGQALQPGKVDRRAVESASLIRHNHTKFRADQDNVD